MQICFVEDNIAFQRPKERGMKFGCGYARRKRQKQNDSKKKWLQMDRCSCGGSTAKKALGTLVSDDSSIVNTTTKSNTVNVKVVL